MKNILKEKKVLVGIVAVVLTVLVVGGFFVLTSKNSKSNTQQASQEEQVLTLSPEEIGLSLKIGKDENTVLIEVTKTEGIQSITFDLLYLSDGDIQRGAQGSINISKTPAVEEVYMGTCSDVCHPEKNPTDINVILKVTKSDGKIYQVKKSL